MDDSASTLPDWAYLPQVAVHLISEKIKCITDYVRFRAVCSPWRSASLPKPRHLPHQLPWLMIPYSIRNTEDDGFRQFYDLWELKMRKIHLPETIGKACCASYRGWLLLVAPGGTELFLLNPLSRAHIQLPPFTIPVKGFEGIWRYFPLHKADFLFMSMMGTSVITKITFSTDLTDPNCVIMVFFQKFQGIYFCKVGDCCWTEVVMRDMPPEELRDAAYNNGSFYLCSEHGISIYNQNKHNGALCIYLFELFETELQSVSKFFFVGKSGLYMIVVRNTEDAGGEQAEEVTGKVPMQKIELYQVIDQESGMMYVKRIADTSNITIFYGDNYHYLAVCTDDWDSLDGGCMYMEYVCLSSGGNEIILNHMDPMNCKAHEPSYGIFFAKLDDDQPKPVVVGIGKMPLIGPPPPSMWFQPNFDSPSGNNTNCECLTCSFPLLSEPA